MKKIIKTIGWTLLALLVCYGLEVLFRALFGLALHKGMTKQEQIRVQIMANFILKLVVLFMPCGKINGITDRITAHYLR